MGNSVLEGRASAVSSGGVITKFYTSAAWIEGRAEAQLEEISGWTGVQKIAAFPDLHPGKYGPVGCAVLADRIFPQLIGNDIGCGMSLFQLDLPVRKLKLEKALRRMRVLGAPVSEDQRWRLEDAGLPTDLFATSLGTVGGGNHFCEVQTLAEAGDGIRLDASRLYLLVHSGSRGFGNAVLGSVPDGTLAGLDPENDTALAYLRDHDRAVRWASLNRHTIAERAAEALRADLMLLVEAPHNLLARHGDGWLHRKGAAVAEHGFVPLAGSRASASYLMSPIAVDFDSNGVRAKHGYKSAVVLISGADAEAFIKNWRGTIQWRAQSNLRPTHKRANWFIGVFDLPAPLQTPERIQASDVTFDTFRAGGPGGQHQNTTDSAVRATHRLTGLSAVAREERSQHRNKSLALERLQHLMAAQAAADEAAQKASRNALHYALERGNPVRCFKGRDFREVKVG